MALGGAEAGAVEVGMRHDDVDRVAALVDGLVETQQHVRPERLGVERLQGRRLVALGVRDLEEDGAALRREVGALERPRRPLAVRHRRSLIGNSRRHGR